MKERPILFSAPMVRAILSGSKNQTRRVVKGAPEDWSPVQPQVYAPTIVDRHGDEQPGPDAFGAGDAQGDHWIRCPYGQPGDRLWVREAFAEEYDYCDHPERPGAPTEHFHFGWHYRADGEPNRANLEGFLSDWKPSIHMPRRASRITLEVTDVKVERLQDISEADAIAEGIIRQSTTGWFSVPGLNGAGTTARAGYALLWNSINGTGSWDANPLVWCVSFKRLEAA